MKPENQSKLKRALLALLFGGIACLPAWFIGGILGVLSQTYGGLESVFFIGFFVIGPAAGFFGAVVVALVVYFRRNRRVLSVMAVGVALVFVAVGLQMFSTIHPWGACQRAIFAGNAPESIDFLAVSPDGRLAAGTGYWDSRIVIWNMETGERLRYLCGPAIGLSTPVFSADNQKLWVFGESGQSLRAWDTQTWQTILTTDLPTGVQYQILPQTEQIVFGVWQLNSNPGVPAERIDFWDLEQNKIDRSLPMNFGYNDFATTADGEWLAVDAGGGQINLHYSDDGRLAKTLFTANEDSFKLYFSPDGQWLVKDISYEGPLHVWNVNTNTLQFSLPGDYEFGGFSADSQSLATIFDGSQVHLWAVETGDLQQRLPASALDDGVMDIHVMDDNKLALVMYWGTPQVWDVANDKHLFTLWP